MTNPSSENLSANSLSNSFILIPSSEKEPNNQNEVTKVAQDALQSPGWFNGFFSAWSKKPTEVTKDAQSNMGTLGALYQGAKEGVQAIGNKVFSVGMGLAVNMTITIVKKNLNEEDIQKADKEIQKYLPNDFEQFLQLKNWTVSYILKLVYTHKKEVLEQFVVDEEDSEKKQRVIETWLKINVAKIFAGIAIHLQRDANKVNHADQHPLINLIAHLSQIFKVKISDQTLYKLESSLHGQAEQIFKNTQAHIYATITKKLTDISQKIKSPVIASLLNLFASNACHSDVLMEKLEQAKLEVKKLENKILYKIIKNELQLIQSQVILLRSLALDIYDSKKRIALLQALFSPDFASPSSPKSKFQMDFSQLYQLAESIESLEDKIDAKRDYLALLLSERIKISKNQQKFKSDSQEWQDLLQKVRDPKKRKESVAFFLQRLSSESIKKINLEQKIAQDVKELIGLLEKVKATKQVDLPEWNSLVQSINKPEVSDPKNPQINIYDPKKRQLAVVTLLDKLNSVPSIEKANNQVNHIELIKNLLDEITKDEAINKCLKELESEEGDLEIALNGLHKNLKTTASLLPKESGITEEGLLKAAQSDKRQRTQVLQVLFSCVPEDLLKESKELDIAQESIKELFLEAAKALLEFFTPPNEKDFGFGIGKKMADVAATVTDKFNVPKQAQEALANYLFEFYKSIRFNPLREKVCVSGVEWYSDLKKTFEWTGEIAKQTPISFNDLVKKLITHNPLVKNWIEKFLSWAILLENNPQSDIENKSLLDSQQQEEITTQATQEPLANWILNALKSLISSSETETSQAGQFIGQVLDRLGASFSAQLKFLMASEHKDIQYLGFKPGLIHTLSQYTKSFESEFMHALFHYFQSLENGEPVTESNIKKFINSLPIPADIQNFLTSQIVDLARRGQLLLVALNEAFVEAEHLHEEALKSFIQIKKEREEVFTIGQDIFNETINLILSKKGEWIDQLDLKQLIANITDKYIPDLMIPDALIANFKEKLKLAGSSAATNEVVLTLKKVLEAVLLTSVVNALRNNLKNTSNLTEKALEIVKTTFEKAYPKDKAQFLDACKLQKMIHDQVKKQEQIRKELEKNKPDLNEEAHKTLILLNQCLHLEEEIADKRQEFEKNQKIVNSRIKDSKFTTAYYQEILAYLSKNQEYINQQKDISKSEQVVKDISKSEQVVAVTNLKQKEEKALNDCLDPTERSQIELRIGLASDLIFILQNLNQNELQALKECLNLEPILLQLEKQYKDSDKEWQEKIKKFQEAKLDDTAKWLLEAQQKKREIFASERLNREYQEDIYKKLGSFPSFVDELLALFGFDKIEQNLDRLLLPSVVKDQIASAFKFLKEKPIAGLLFEQLSPIFMVHLEKEEKCKLLVQKMGDNPFVGDLISEVVKLVIVGTEGKPGKINDYIKSYREFAELLIKTVSGKDEFKLEESNRVSSALIELMQDADRRAALTEADLINLTAQILNIDPVADKEAKVKRINDAKVVKHIQRVLVTPEELARDLEALIPGASYTRLGVFFDSYTNVAGEIIALLKNKQEVPEAEAKMLGRAIFKEIEKLKAPLTYPQLIGIYQRKIAPVTDPEKAIETLTSQNLLKKITKVQEDIDKQIKEQEAIGFVDQATHTVHSNFRTLIKAEIEQVLKSNAPAFKEVRGALASYLEGLLFHIFSKIADKNTVRGRSFLNQVTEKLKKYPLLIAKSSLGEKLFKEVTGELPPKSVLENLDKAIGKLKEEDGTVDKLLQVVVDSLPAHKKPSEAQKQAWKTKIESLGASFSAIQMKLNTYAFIEGCLSDVIGIQSENDLDELPPALRTIVYKTIQEQLKLHLTPLVSPLIEREVNQKLLKQKTGSDLFSSLAISFAKTVTTKLPECIDDYKEYAKAIIKELSEKDPTNEQIDALAVKIEEYRQKSKPKSITNRELVKAYAEVLKLDLDADKIQHCISQLRGLKVGYRTIKEAILGIQISSAQLANEIGSRLPQELQEGLGHEIQKFFHLQGEAYEHLIHSKAKGQSFIEHYLEGIFLKIGLKLVEKNPPESKTGKTVLVVIAEKLLKIVVEARQEQQINKLTPEDLTQLINDKVLGLIFGIHSKADLEGLPPALQSKVYLLLRSSIRDLLNHCLASLGTLQDNQASVQAAKQNLNELLAGGSLNLIAEDLGKMAVDAVPHLLGRVINGQVAGATLINEAIKQLLGNLKHAHFEIADVLLKYLSDNRELHLVVSGPLYEIADPANLVQEKALVAQIVGNALLIPIHEGISRLTQEEKDRKQELDGKILKTMLTCALAHFKTMKEAKSEAVKRGQKHFTHADFVLASEKNGSLHPAFVKTPADYAPVVNRINGKLANRLSDAQKTQLADLLANLFEEDLSLKQALTNDIAIAAIDRLVHLTDEEKTSLLAVNDGLDLKDHIRQLGGAAKLHKNKNFYGPLGKDLLKALFPNGRQDLTFIPPELRNWVWTLLKRELLPVILPLLMETLLDPTNMTNILNTSLESLKETLNGPISLDPPAAETDETRAIDEIIGELMVTVLDHANIPDWIVKKLTTKDAAGKLIYAASLGAALRTQFTGQYVQEMVKNAAHKLAERDPKTHTPILHYDSRDEAVKAKDQAKRVKTEESKFASLCQDVIDASLFYLIRSKWAEIQKRWDDAIKAKYPNQGMKVKAALDAVFRFIFIKVMATGLYYLFYPIVKLVKLGIYAHLNLKENGETVLDWFRKKPDGQPKDSYTLYHENLVFQLIEGFKKDLENRPQVA